MTGFGFGTNEYGKAALAYAAVKDLLGDDLFKKCLQEYMNRWHGKHPLPWDFFNTFNNVSGKNLNWFWNNWFFGTGYIDYKIGEIQKTPAGYTVNVENVGGLIAPFNIAVKYTDGTQEKVHMNPASIKTDQRHAIEIATKKTLQSVTLDGGIFMDADTTNNIKDAGKKGF